MTDLRKDLLLNRWVLVAENRSERPNDYATPLATTKENLPQDATNCPFCPSLETQTPPAVYSACNAEGDWQVRVVPNKYTAVGTAMGGDESGVHEVVIESPRHGPKHSGSHTTRACQRIRGLQRATGALVRGWSLWVCHDF